MSSLKLVITIGTISAVIAAAAAIALYAQIVASTTNENPSVTSSTIEEVKGNSDVVISSPYVKEFPLPNETWPNGILVDSKGIVWTVGSKSHALISFNPEQGRTKSYSVPSSESSGFSLVWTMVEGKDESIWFSGSGRDPIWRFEPRTEQFESIESVSAPPIQMEVDDAGNIWYTTLHSGVIGVVQKKGQMYDVKELELGKESFPSGVFMQNQTLWITQSFDGKITIFDISRSQEGRIADITKMTEFPQQEVLFSPTDIIIHNGSAWVTEHGTSFLTEYNTKTLEMKRYPTALHPIHVSTLPYWLEADTGGEGVWFNEHRGNRIAFFDFPSRTLTEYEVPTRNPEMGYIANVLTIAVDPTDRNKVWFTEFTEDKIGYVDRSLPIPFDIRAIDKQIVVEKGQTAQINIEITRNPDLGLFNNTLSLGVSSSAVISGALLNATASFSPSLIDLSKVNEIQTVTLELKDEGIQKGNHILAVSVSDGAVVRTVYVELVVK